MFGSTRNRASTKLLRSNLSIERLEARSLLSADFCPHLAVSAEPATTSPLSTSESIRAIGAADAGSSFTTAADLGSIDGRKSVSGTLGWRDYVDMFRFTLEQDAQLTLDLSGRRQTANLYLFDSAGGWLASSAAAGIGSEQISISVPSGTYWIAAVSGSFLPNLYQLSVSARLESPPPALADPLSPAENPPATVVQPGPVTPLTEVPTFGGSREWGLNAIGAPEAWAAGYTGAGITVAVVDSGVDLDHPDLIHSLYVNRGEIAGNGIDDDRNGYVDDVQGYDFVDRDGVADDTNGHGTHVAGIIAAANNGFGATGVAPDATIIPVRVLDSNGSGWANDVAAGIRYAADLGADIINLSLGGGYSRVIESAVDYARSLGSLIVAAAGNEGAAVPGYPARFSETDSNVISVGAYSSSGAIAGFSNEVGNSQAVQVDAPGVGIFGTYRDGRYATLSGTSMAAPHIAGLAALALSSNPNLTSAQLRQLLVSGATGSARNSDSIGIASAKTTVAYAAAGMIKSPTAVTANAASGSNVSTLVRARALIAGSLIAGVSGADAMRDTRARASALAERSFAGVEPVLDAARKIKRALDFTVPSGPRNSALDLYFEALTDHDQGQFGTLLGPDSEDFA